MKRERGAMMKNASPIELFAAQLEKQSILIEIFKFFQ
jgi:hypothetical protein